MTSYQKLKTERDILWQELEEWIEIYFQLLRESENEDVISGRISAQKEIAYIKALIEERTNEDTEAKA